jgi:hypothetical protein
MRWNDEYGPIRNAGDEGVSNEIELNVIDVPLEIPFVAQRMFPFGSLRLVPGCMPGRRDNRHAAVAEYVMVALELRNRMLRLERTGPGRRWRSSLRPPGAVTANFANYRVASRFALCIDIGGSHEVVVVPEDLPVRRHL